MNTVIILFILQGEIQISLHSLYTSHHHYQVGQAEILKQCIHNGDAAGTNNSLTYKQRNQTEKQEATYKLWNFCS